VHFIAVITNDHGDFIRVRRKSNCLIYATTFQYGEGEVRAKAQNNNYPYARFPLYTRLFAQSLRFAQREAQPEPESDKAKP